MGGVGILPCRDVPVARPWQQLVSTAKACGGESLLEPPGAWVAGYGGGSGWEGPSPEEVVGRSGWSQGPGPQGLVAQRQQPGFRSECHENPWRGFSKRVTMLCIFKKNPLTAAWTAACREAGEAW